MKPRTLLPDPHRPDIDCLQANTLPKTWFFDISVVLRDRAGPARGFTTPCAIQLRGEAETMQ